jgi:multiple sugar transport system ATP-binding protein
MTLADRVVVLRDGRIEQVGTPLELYDRPANQFVAQFIGTPKMNVVPVAKLPAVRPGTTKLPADGSIGLRPEHIAVRSAGSAQFDAQVELVEALGAETLVYLRTAEGAELTARQNTRSAAHAGDTVGVELDWDAAHLFDGEGRMLPGAAATVHPFVPRQVHG